MRQQDIQKIIEQVEACSESLKKLCVTISEVEEDARENKDIDTVGEAIKCGIMTATLRVRIHAQLNELKDLIAEINNK